MYLEFFSLKKKPFHVTPDPDFIYLSESHKEALASIIYGTEQKKGFIAITGAVGVGKTTILRLYLAQLQENPDGHVKTICILNPNLSFKDLLKSIYQEMEIEPGDEDVAGMVNHLHHVLIEEYGKGNNVVLVIDEAQNTPVETLENLRMLSNLETTTDKLIQIVLIGQSELDELLGRHELRQLKQRIAVRATIQPLSARESREYIAYRLTKAGSKEGSVFAERAIRKIVKEAQGVPRNINVICDNSLITGFGYQKNPVTLKIVEEVCADLKGRPAARSSWAGFRRIVRKPVALSGIILGILALGSLSWFMFRHPHAALVSPVNRSGHVETSRPTVHGDDTVPQSLAGADDGEYMIVCERSTKKLYIYRSVHGNIEQAGTYPYAGLRDRNGATDIPRGIHFLERMDRKSRTGKDNVIPIDYGTGHSGAVGFSRGTTGDVSGGYVLLKGDVVRRVPGGARQEGTPLVVVDKVQAGNFYERKEISQELRAVLEGWRKAWENKDIGKYFGYYADGFTNGNGMDLQTFKEYKKRILGSKNRISVEIRQMVFLLPPESGGKAAVVKFSQTYRSNKFKDVSIKAIYLRREESGFKIVKELNVARTVSGVRRTVG